MNTIVLDQAWQYTTVAEDETHHLLDDKPLYSKRFFKVLKYHQPGLAPVVDETGAFHINVQAEPLYQDRYIQTFGYYDERAAVENTNGWFHIDISGKRCYSNTYAWCGNYQEGFCPVQDNHTRYYYHINKQGQRIYQAEYCYVGDYRDGIAVVCNNQGLQTHIDKQGKLLHNCWFLGLDVFHKSIARAQDKQGWFHIDKTGCSLYSQRYKAIEPFYNNRAVVEDFDGSLSIIDPTGKQIHIIRPANCNLLQELSADLVGFWKTQTIYAAVQIKIFDQLPDTSSNLTVKLKLNPHHCERLLGALQELTLVSNNGGYWQLTPKGRLLTPCAISPMAAAAHVWGESHYQQWTKLTEKLYGSQTDTHSYFEKLAQNKAQLLSYQRALSGYAKQDYQPIIKAINWSQHQTVIDAGGGIGTLLHLLVQHHPHLQGILLEKPAVLSLIAESARYANCRYIGIDLRAAWPCQADAIIFARVLHDWPNDSAAHLLKRAKASLLPQGKIYLLEMVMESGQKQGSLLDLNMLVMTGGQERTLHDWQHLVNRARLKLVRHQVLSPIVSILELTAL